ncbi:MAG: glyoxalase family protein [Solirubrobacteraceae bacterium]|jgi:glyoxalase family protein|nr:glyoxalase family protein [Solirubrobacteraceae bacterium]
MQLVGLHHITMITGDAQRNVDFYADLLGLRLVKKTVNFDAPDAYHLYFGDEAGSPGSILTWFEFAGAARGQPGRGMIHTLRLGVGSPAALEFWRERLQAAGTATEDDAEHLRFSDYDGLQYTLEVSSATNPPLRARHPEVPAEYAIGELIGARAFGSGAAGEGDWLVETLGFEASPGDGFRLAGAQRTFEWAYDPPPLEWGSQGAGSVHHIAWASRDGDHLDWQQRVREAGGLVTDVRDRDYFRSIYFREPRGILFEIATLSPGFAVDEEPEHLGEGLRLPRMHEHLRPVLEQTLAPIVNPRQRREELAS